MLDPKKTTILDSCFKARDQFGWCGTCIQDAKPGTPGYCGPGAQNIEAEAPLITANSTNWGFCESHCQTENMFTDVLRVSFQT